MLQLPSTGNDGVRYPVKRKQRASGKSADWWPTGDANRDSRVLQVDRLDDATQQRAASVQVVSMLSFSISLGVKMDKRLSAPHMRGELLFRNKKM